MKTKNLIRLVFFIVPLLFLGYWLFWPGGFSAHDPLARSGLAPGIYTNLYAGKDYNPDVPPFAEHLVDESLYLQMRDTAVAQMRGLPYDLPYDARVLALEQMQQQASGRAPFFGTPTWNFVGPAPMPNGQTNTQSAPVSGRTIAIAVHPTNSDIAYVGTAQGGLYRTLDGGQTWTPLMDNALSLAIGAITIDPTDSTRLFIGTGENSNSCDSYAGVGLYIITNAETTANLAGPYNQNSVGANVLGKRSVGEILVDPVDPNKILLAMGGGIGGIGCSTPAAAPTRGLYRSTNVLSASPTFEYVPVSASTDKRVIDLLYDPNDVTHGTVLATVLDATTTTTGEAGIYHTTDVWAVTPIFTRVYTPITSTSSESARIELSTNGSVFVAGTGEGGGKIIKSPDGITWTAVTGGTGFCSPQCWYDMGIAVDPDDSNIIHVGGAFNTVFIRSTNGGTSFSPVDVGLHADSHVVTVAPSNPNIVYLGSDGGIWRSTNRGASYTSLNNSGFSATQFMGIELHPVDPDFMIGGTQDNGTPCYGECGGNANQTWIRADWGDGGYAVIDQNATNTSDVTIYHTYYNQTNNLIGYGRITNTASASDGSWVFFGCGGTANGISCADAVRFYAPLERGPGNPNTLYFGTSKLYRSSNEGVTMTAVSQNLGAAASAIAIAPANDNVRLVGLTTGQVFATSTGSSTLVDVTPPTSPFPTTFDVGAAAIDPTNSAIAYVTYSGYFGTPGFNVWKTTNLSAGASATWTASANGLPDVPINAIVIHPTQPNLVFVGTDIGVYASTDGGATWLPFGTGLPQVAIFGLEIHPVTFMLRAATHGRGIWETSLDTTTTWLMYMPLLAKPAE